MPAHKTRHLKVVYTTTAGNTFTDVVEVPDSCDDNEIKRAIDTIIRSCFPRQTVLPFTADRIILIAPVSPVALESKKL